MLKETGEKYPLPDIYQITANNSQPQWLLRNYGTCCRGKAEQLALDFRNFKGPLCKGCQL
ncbi:Hypothetical predicted protein [Paramuricea clavata]|uniref:Uncharacterized protein n=1 Tax=Paramuricea clavata TaxID=317549 RepID=A0A7D9F030_PARCT|nr:Hypothetical predicted protein [Paramuricea clavata]